jgi:predicted anti-sigma-YlaC factor YlaD
MLEYVLNGSHEETGRLMSAYAESELRGLARWRVARHLARCDSCRAAFRALLATIENMRALARSEPPAKPELADAVLERIRAQERAEGGAAPGDEGT